MNLLAIDTSTELASVALSFHGEKRSKTKSGFRDHAHSILPLIEALLAEVGCTLGQLDAIVYGRGPGSFTGLRIGCSIAKGLAYSHDLPLFPVSTLSAIAWRVKSQSQTSEPLNGLKQQAAILCLLDARMEQVYWAYFKPSSSHPEIETQEFVTNAATIDLVLENPLIVAGVNFENYFKELNPSLQDQVIQQYRIYPHAETMLEIAFTKKIKPVSAAEASLVYIRNQITQRAPPWTNDYLSC